MVEGVTFMLHSHQCNLFDASDADDLSWPNFEMKQKKIPPKALIFFLFASKYHPVSPLQHPPSKIGHI